MNLNKSCRGEINLPTALEFTKYINIKMKKRMWGYNIYIN